ncbi:MAG: DsbA family protein [Chlamydiia bacterium]
MAGRTLEQKLVLGSVTILTLITVYLFGFWQHDLPPSIAIDTTGQPVMGNRFAPLEIVVFLDPKCPVCRVFHQSVLPEICEAYVTPNYARVCFIPITFLSGARPAGMALLEVYHQNPDLFFHFLEDLYAEQGLEEDDWCTPDFLKHIASEVAGVDADAVYEAIISAKYSATLDHNLSIALDIMHGQVLTPSVFVEGMPVREPTFDSIEDLCERTLDAYGVH